MDGVSEHPPSECSGERVGLWKPAHAPSATRRIFVDTREASSSGECGQVQSQRYVTRVCLSFHFAPDPQDSTGELIASAGDGELL